MSGNTAEARERSAVASGSSGEPSRPAAPVSGTPEEPATGRAPVAPVPGTSEPSFLRRYRLPLALAVIALCLYAGSIVYILFGRGQIA